MTSRWDDLDASSQIEQAIAEALTEALGPRAVSVQHNGTATRHAGPGKPDIEAADRVGHFKMLIEVTKRRGAQAEGEYSSTTDHLEHAIAAGGFEDYGLLFVAPYVGARLRKNFLAFNRQREADGKPGRAFMLDFAGLETVVDEMRRRDSSLYPWERWRELFRVENWSRATDDFVARQVVAEVCLGEAHELREKLTEEAQEEHAKQEQQLKKQIANLENQLRDRGIAGDNANRTLIYLTFMRLFEEKATQERGQAINRMTARGFQQWASSQGAQVRQEHRNRLVNYLLGEMRADSNEGLDQSGLLRNADGSPANLHPSVTDELVKDLVFPVLDDYDFFGSKVDILGVVFETLARRGEKDTRIGQFFTPQEVVEFGADIAELDPRDVVLDPAVGTARFLIAAMRRMIAGAPLAGLPLEQTIRAIKSEQLLGADIGDWVANIAKLNMYIHGDGKSNVVNTNGLILGDRNLIPLSRYAPGIRGKIDVVLTNPPLGDVNFTYAARDWQTAGSAHEDVSKFYRQLGTVPLTVRELAEKQRLAEELATLDASISELEEQERSTERDAALRSQRKKRASRKSRLDDIDSRIARGDLTHIPNGSKLKGGALFLGAIAQYLTDNTAHRSALPVEWRGGRAIVVVDEAILNTAAHEATRQFIRRNFYVKAVISLGRAAFKYLAHTDAKTSVIYLIKKPNPNYEQQEPIFFDHAERVGYSPSGEWVGSDLPEILRSYSLFRAAVQAGYRGASYDATEVTTAANMLPGVGVKWHSREIGTGRLDYFDARRRDLETAIEASAGQAVRLSEVLEVRTRTPPAATRNDSYDFAAIDRTTVAIAYKGRQSTKYQPRDLWTVEEGDIVVSGIDFVHGSVAYAAPDVAGLVMSKEMFAYRIRADVQAIPEYIVLALRTPVARALATGLVSGTSNRNRLREASQLLDLVIPPLPSVEEQEVISSHFRAAHLARLDHQGELAAAAQLAAKEWPVAIEASDVDSDGEVLVEEDEAGR